MPKVIFVAQDGTRHSMEADGESLMQVATGNGIDGIIGECGGNCMCATCHVYVAEADLARLPPQSPEEDALLDGTAAERRPNSRLGCQIRMSASLDGLTVFIPERQI
jgi:2Fe-2S ferredoxin